MTQPKIHTKAPAKIVLEKGKMYAFCTCGHSDMQPFCDGTHREKAPEYKFLSSEPIAIDLAYADANHSRNIFDEALYHDKARLWAHKDLAKIILLTARMLHKKYNWTLELKDCLRTSNSQQAMQETALVKAHPEWREGPSRLLAPPGAGAHPRAMAIDVCVLDNDGNEIDMGTPFDHLDHESARDYIHFPEQILRNRKNLEDAFTQSAETLKFPFLPYSAKCR